MQHGAQVAALAQNGVAVAAAPFPIAQPLQVLARALPLARAPHKTATEEGIRVSCTLEVCRKWVGGIFEARRGARTGRVRPAGGLRCRGSLACLCARVSTLRGS